MTSTKVDVRQDRSPGVSYQELLDTDTKPVPEVLRLESAPFLGTDDIPVERYISREFHELEKVHLWSKVWQVACREEDIPAVGDTEVYDICDISILVVRSAPNDIKAFYNACLHRGRKLRTVAGPVEEIRCPFHGFCWDTSGALEQVPCAWDFPQVDAEAFHLPEVNVGTWGGFVFVNMDPDCEPLDAFLGSLPDHFRRWPLEDRFTEAMVDKVLDCNWKVAQEAFMEAFHVVTTHPQLLAGIGDANSQYDVWENFSRAITPNGTPSPHLRWTPTEQEMFNAMIDQRADEPLLAEIPDGMTARRMSAEGGRRMLAPAIGDDAARDLSDAELADSFYYTLFPNLHPWGAYNRICYRFRPHGDDHERSIMEVRFLSPFPPGERPPSAKCRHLGVDDDWYEATELGLLARIFHQDTFNLPNVQRGLHTLARTKSGVTMGAYQELKLRHFHRLLERTLDL